MRRKQTRILLALVLILCLLAACTPAENQGGELPKVDLKLKPEEYPRVDGSTATIPLSEAFATAVMDMDITEARQYIVHNKTHEAYMNLIHGNTHIIFVTSPSEEELAEAKAVGIELEVVPVVSEGFVFLVNKDNPVKSLTFQQIKDIYAGKITNWKEVGGEDKTIVAYQRPENSGSQTGMLDLVIGPDEIMDPPMEQVIGEMGGLIDAVAVYNNQEDGIGYSYYYFASDMWKNEDVRLLAVDGVSPDDETISDGSYPIRTAYYAVLRSDEPKESNARKLLEWILSEEGQQVAEEAGYVKRGKQ